MPWTYDKSRERIERVANAIPDISIGDLTREMTLGNVTLAQPKRISGVHLYVAVANEQQLLDQALDDCDAEVAKAPIRQLHLYQRELNRVVNDFGSALIHFQGSRQHSLTYKPFSDEKGLVGRAVTMACAIRTTVEQAFNPAMGDQPALTCAAGGSYGPTLATKSGSRGDAELLFVGDAANRAAKGIELDVPLRLGAEIVELLDEDLGVETSLDADGIYRACMSLEAIEDAVERYGLGWSIDQSRRRIEDDIESIPPDVVGISKAISEIDKDRLSLARTKLNHAVSLFGDLDGFTAIVEGAANDDEQAQLVRDFHIVRAELRHVAVQDYAPTLRVQYQGDRIQALRHLPHDDSAERALQAVRVAAGWQSSMRETLPEFIELEDLGLAVGLAAGGTVVSKLGTRGNRDVIAVGSSVRRADRIQRHLDAGEVGIDGTIKEELPEDLASRFEWRAGTQGHVAGGLTVDDVELAVEAQSFDEGMSQRISVDGGRVSTRTAVSAVPLSTELPTAREKPKPEKDPKPPKPKKPKEHDAVPRRRWAH